MKITAGLDARKDVQIRKMGEGFDLWHGDFCDLEDN